MADEKNIFPYHNGTSSAYGDPVYLRRRLTLLLDGNAEKVLAQARFESSPQWSAEERAAKLVEAELANDLLVKASRDAFALVPFDKQTGSGATDEQALDVLYAFLSWLQKKKRKAGSFLTSQATTA